MKFVEFPFNNYELLFFYKYITLHTKYIYMLYFSKLYGKKLNRRQNLKKI